MSTAIPTTLNHEQRSEAFERALALEEGLEKLEALKKECLAALARHAEGMRREHARLMRAATTGTNPDAPEQQALPLEPAPSQAPAAKASPEEDEQLPPEPPKGRGRVRKPAPEKTGETRAEDKGSTRARPARTSARASRLPPQHVVTQAFLDAIPAPRVPCCECTHSVADHKDGAGRCGGKANGRPCKCKRFTAVSVDLPGAPGWKVRPFKGQLSTGDGGERAYTLLGEDRETLPLWWVPTYGLAFQNGTAVSCVFPSEGMKATTLTYEKDARWNWVPREVLRALAEHMGATWPEDAEEPAPAEESQAEQVPAGEALPRLNATPEHPCECDGCGETVKASELQPVGNGFYCPKCKAEADEQDGDEEVDSRQLSGDALEQYREHLREMVGSDTVTCAACRREHLAGPCPPPNGVDEPAELGIEVADAPSAEASGTAIPELDDPFTTPPTDGEVDPSFNELDLTALHKVLGEPPAGEFRTYKVTLDGSSPRACEACGTRERPRAFISFDREDRKSKRGQYTGGGGFAMALCLQHSTVEGVEQAWSNRAGWVERDRLAREQAAHPTATSAPPASPTPPLDYFGKPWPAVDEARFPGWFVWVIPGVHGNPDSITAGRLHELFFDMDVMGPEGQDIRHLRWFPAAEGGRGDLCVGPHTEPREFALAAFPPGLYAALVGHLAKHWPLPEETKAAAQAPAAAPPPKAKKARSKRKTAPVPDASSTACGHLHEKTGARCADPAGHGGGWHHGPAAPGGGARPRWKNDAYQYEGPKARSGEAPAASVGMSSAWRVELPERNEHSIIRLWLVNDSTGERKPATWWGGVSALRRSHHLSGKLEGEALATHLELETWWKENADAVVIPLAGDCREGRVPGLKVYEPESLGNGPHTYALSNGWTLEAWEGEGDEAEPSVHFTRPTVRADVWDRFGPFVLTVEVRLTTADAEAAEWSAENETVVSEAEGFIARGFILELRREVAA